MLLKILTLLVTVSVLVIAFAPLLKPPFRRTEPAFPCDRCARGYHDATTLAWHRHAMHPELVAEILDDGERMVGRVQSLVRADPAAEPNRVVEPNRVDVDDDVVEVRSGNTVYRVFTGGRK